LLKTNSAYGQTYLIDGVRKSEYTLYIAEGIDSIPMTYQSTPSVYLINDD